MQSKNNLKAVQHGLMAMSSTLMKDLKILRGETHRVFDQLWQEGYMTRTEAYIWLSQAMHLPREKAHIEQFTHAQCYDCMRHVNKWLNSQADYLDPFEMAVAIYGGKDW